MQLILIFTSSLITLLGLFIVYRFFKSGNRITSSASTFTLLFLVLNLSIIRLGLIFDIFDISILQFSVKSSLFFIISAYVNPLLIIVHCYYLVKPRGLIKRLLQALLAAFIILLTLYFFDYSIIELKPVELVLLFNFCFLLLVNLEIFFLSKIWDAQFKIWIIAISMVQIITILMKIFQIQDESIKGDYSTLINNQMNLIILNILILLCIFLILQFPRIISGDIGFDINYSRIDKLEKTILSSTAYASLNPELWRFVHGSSTYTKFTTHKNLMTQLDRHSSEIYHKITLYEFSGIQNLDEDIFVNDLYLLSQKLKVSSAILELFFTLYCNYSWSKYTKLLRVLRAEYLISNDFLFKNDMNALALKVGFNNRVTLYNNFKDFLGRPPSSSK